MSLDELKKLAAIELSTQHFEGLALGVIDFACASFDSFILAPEVFREHGPLYFDLASLTKPLTLGACALAHPELFNSKELLLLLEHRSGLPIWGRISKGEWRREVSQFEIHESECAYSDYGALRLQVEIEKRLQKPLYDVVSKYWDIEVKNWLDLPLEASFLPTGERARAPIWGEVMDDNAYMIGERVSHAGLFGTIEGVCRSLLSFESEFKLLEHMSAEIEKRPGRFSRGWDTTRNNQNSLAGEGHSALTFGHLGFTGTSIWIDPLLQRGAVLLTNATQNYWYDRAGLNRLRRNLGRAIWQLPGLK